MIKKTIKRIYHKIFCRVLLKHKSINAHFPLSFSENHKYPEVEFLWDKFTYDSIRENPKDFFRFYSFILNINNMISTGIKGDFAEVGVYKGNTAAILAYYAEKTNNSLYLFDTFDGFDDRDLVGIDEQKYYDFRDTSVGAVKALTGDYEKIFYIQGYFPDSVTDECRERKYAFVHLDCDLYQPMLDGLKFFYPRLIGGGYDFLP